MSDTREISTRDAPEPTSVPEGVSPRGIAAIQGTEERLPRSDSTTPTNAQDNTDIRVPVNSKYADDVYSFADKSPELHEKHPEGVRFNADGYPDFSPYALETVEIDMKGNHTTDYTDATAQAGLAEIPEGYTWHHHQDCKTMQLLPSDLHGNIRHTGGVSIIKNGGDEQ